MAVHYVFLILAQLMVGISIVSTKYLVPYVPMVFLLAVRFGLATVILFVLHGFTNAAKTTVSDLQKLTKKDWIFIIIQGLCAGVFFNSLMLWGLNYTSANVAGIITSVLPALIAVLSSIVLKEHLSGKKAFCILFATIGLMIIGLNELKGSSNNHSLHGDFIIFCALLPEAGYYILSKLHPTRLPVFLISALLNSVNAICLLPLAFIQVEQHLLHISDLQWFVLILLSIVTAFFYIFWYLGSRKVDGMTASLSTTLMPIATVIVAWLTLGEFINVIQLIGMGCVMASIVAYTFS